MIQYHIIFYQLLFASHCPIPSITPSTLTIFYDCPSFVFLTHKDGILSCMLSALLPSPHFRSLFYWHLYSISPANITPSILPAATLLPQIISTTIHLTSQTCSCSHYNLPFVVTLPTLPFPILPPLIYYHSFFLNPSTTIYMPLFLITLLWLKGDRNRTVRFLSCWVQALAIN